MTTLYKIHGVTYKLSSIKSKLLKLPVDRFKRLKDAFVGKNEKLELLWHNAIIMGNDQAMYISEIPVHIESNISEKTWNSL